MTTFNPFLAPRQIKEPLRPPPISHWVHVNERFKNTRAEDHETRWHYMSFADKMGDAVTYKNGTSPRDGQLVIAKLKKNPHHGWAHFRITKDAEHRLCLVDYEYFIPTLQGDLQSLGHLEDQLLGAWHLDDKYDANSIHAPFRWMYNTVFGLEMPETVSDDDLQKTIETHKDTYILACLRERVWKERTFTTLTPVMLGASRDQSV